MKSPSREKVSPAYWTSDGGTICTSLFVLTWRTRKLCCPFAVVTWTTYFPSGEMAALSAVPVLVSRAIFMLGARLGPGGDTGEVDQRYATNNTIDSATTPITPTSNATMPE